MRAGGPKDMKRREWGSVPVHGGRGRERERERERGTEGGRERGREREREG